MKLRQQLKGLMLSAAVISSLLLSACHDVPVETTRPTAHQYDHQVYWKWNEKFLEIDRTARGYRPGPSPRALGYLGLAAYEAVIAGIPENNSMANLMPGLDVPKADPDEEYYWPACVNESYAYLMTRFFFSMENEQPTLFESIELTRAQLHDQYAQATSPEILARSEAFGLKVAQAVYEFESSDLIGHNAFLNAQPLDYVPPVGPGKWKPTSPDFSRAMFPNWGRVRTFAISETDKLCKPPIPYSENPQSLYYNQGMEVYNTVNMINNPGPDQQAAAYEQRWMAEFWSDDILNLTFSPPARLLAIADQVIASEQMDLAGCAELFAKMGFALSDGGVACWYSKYYYNIERPATYIQNVIAKDYPDAANWQTILKNTNNGLYITPAFPAYPSGHSSFAGAGAKILSSFFEFNQHHPGTYTFTDLCHRDRSDFIGTPRTFTSFKQLADENAYSRVPLGVHWRMDCTAGLDIGERVAQRVLEMPWKK